MWNRMFSFSQWVLAIKKKESPHFNIFYPPIDRYWADPFIVEDSGKVFIFFEEYIFSKKKGHISVGELSECGKKIINIKKILRGENHYSYPFIFKHKRRWYMVPETLDKNKIELYTSDNFPYEWRTVRTLVSDIQAVDSTILEKDGLFYLLTTVGTKEGRSLNNNLNIYYADDLLQGEFKPVNKIMRTHHGLYNSRMAGSIVTNGTNHFRLAQNCYNGYGSSININLINSIRQAEYSETYLMTLPRPGWANRMHTYNESENFSIIDLNVRIRNPLKILIFKAHRLMTKVNR